MTTLPGAQNSWGTESCPHLVEGLDISDQDAQVLNPKVRIVVDVLVDGLLSRPGITGGTNRRMEMASPSFAAPPCPAADSPLQV